VRVAALRSAPLRVLSAPSAASGGMALAYLRVALIIAPCMACGGGNSASRMAAHLKAQRSSYISAIIGAQRKCSAAKCIGGGKCEGEQKCGGRRIVKKATR